MSALDQKWHVIDNSKRRARCATHNYRPTSYKSGAFVCPSLRGLPLQPCFTLERTSDISFRGSIYGLAFAYCEFTRHRAQTILAHQTHRSNSAQPFNLRPSLSADKD
jgi:hypothetical protein